MKNLLIILFLFFVFIANSSTAYPQNNATNLKVDSLKKVLQSQKEDTNKVNTLNSISKALWRNRDYLNALNYANEAFLLADKTNFQKGKVDAFLSMSQIYKSQPGYLDINKKNDTLKALIYNGIAGSYLWNDNDSALYYSNKALALSNKLHFITGMIVANDYISTAYSLLRNDVKAIQFSFKTLELAEKYNDELKKYNINYKQWVLRDAGTVYFSIGDYTNALNYYFKIASSKKDYWKTDDYDIGFLIGQCYYELNSLDSALYYINISLANTQRKGLDWNFYHNLIGNIYRKKGYYDISLRELRKALLLTKLEDTKLVYPKGAADTIKTKISLAQTLYAIGNYDSSLYYAKEAMASEKFQSFPDQQLQTFYLLKDLYSVKNKTDSAYKYAHLTINLKDSLYNIDKTRTVQRIQFEQEIKNREVLREREAYENRVKLYALIAGLIIFCFIASILYHNNRKKQKAYALLQIHQQETDIQKAKAEQALQELRTTQAQLIQSEKMASLGQLTAGIAHEIQNPLNFVNNFSEVNKELIAEMKQEIDKGNIEEVKAIANDIEENEQKIAHHGKRADAIVKGMLQHSRSSSGEKQLTDINALTEEYLRLSYQAMRSKDKSFNATINKDFDNSIGKISIIPQDMSRVILNLLNNAFYAVQQKKQQLNSTFEPTVSISTKKLNDKIEISVGDNGIGISQKIVDKIFQPFFTTKPTGEGTGLGLSLSYDIIKAHGGELKVVGTNVKGATFIIELPIENI